MLPLRTVCAAQTASVDVNGLLVFTALRLIYLPHIPHRFLHVYLRVSRGNYRIMDPGEKNTKSSTPAFKLKKHTQKNLFHKEGDFI